MSQSTMNLANQSGASFRQANNAALQALAGNNSGATAPTETYPYMPWADTAAGLLKMRNAANTAWIELNSLSNGISAFARTLLDDADAATARATLGVDDAAKIAVNQLAFRNKIINGDMQVDQRRAGSASTVVGGAGTLAFGLDRWRVRSAGADATVQQIDIWGTKRLRFTGAASVSAVAAHQRIESANCAHLATGSVTLSLRASSTSLTSLTLELYYANSTNAFGTWAAPTVTLVSSQVVAINSTEQTVSATFALPQAAYAGLEVRIVGGALGAGQTLTIGMVQLEEGQIATPYEHRPFGTELSLSQRYYAKTFLYGVIPASALNDRRGSLRAYAWTTAASTVPIGTTWQFPVPMFDEPTITLFDPNASGTSWRNNGNTGSAVSAVAEISNQSALIYINATLGAADSFVIHATAEREL